MQADSVHPIAKAPIACVCDFCVIINLVIRYGNMPKPMSVSEQQFDLMLFKALVAHASALADCDGGDSEQEQARHVHHTPFNGQLHEPSGKLSVVNLFNQHFCVGTLACGWNDGTKLHFACRTSSTSCGWGGGCGDITEGVLVISLHILQMYHGRVDICVRVWVGSAGSKCGHSWLSCSRCSFESCKLHRKGDAYTIKNAHVLSPLPGG